jgi:hypothetical protein
MILFFFLILPFLLQFFSCRWQIFSVIYAFILHGIVRPFPYDSASYWDRIQAQEKRKKKKKKKKRNNAYSIYVLSSIKCQMLRESGMKEEILIVDKGNDTETKRIHISPWWLLSSVIILDVFQILLLH